MSLAFLTKVSDLVDNVKSDNDRDDANSKNILI